MGTENVSDFSFHSKLEFRLLVELLGACFRIYKQTIESTQPQMWVIDDFFIVTLVQCGQETHKSTILIKHHQRAGFHQLIFNTRLSQAPPGTTNRGRKKTISLDPPQVTVHPSTGDRGTPLPSKRQKVVGRIHLNTEHTHSEAHTHTCIYSLKRRRPGYLTSNALFYGEPLSDGGQIFVC